MDEQKIKEMALESGFTTVGNLDADTIELRTEVRADCATNKCGAYDTNWSCPPACGELDECTQTIRQYKKGLILQTTTELEDQFDFEGMEEAYEKHKKAIIDFTKKIKKEYPDAMILTAGACTMCEACTYPDEPCRFPNLMSSSMEAYGIVVSDLCSANDIKYYYGPNTLTYVGCVLVE